ncbi:TonB-dependent receptor domain-containing protein [Labilibaculum sp.]|uniref:TonB-dependent receptor domain-containing protein n=1 Tax=Labilibaculum sp. TaxID=2060723 RepID=UPI0035692694
MNLKFNKRESVLYVFLLLLGSSFASLAQNNTKILSNSSLKGIVVDNENHKTLEYATVSLYSLPDSSMLKGTLTNRKGEFTIDNLKASTYFYKVDFLGFNTHTSDYFILNEDENKILSNPIVLSVDSKEISQVEVIGNRDFAKLELDRTVYNVSKSPVSDGGTINDVLATIPKLNVNADGDIQFRGSSNVKVLIDGKMSGLLGMSPSDVLSNMPAAEVDRVELITSPSSKYDASGSAGIINIIMKKERAKGFNGNASATIGTINKHSGQTALNLRTGKLNFTGSYSYKDDWSGRDYSLSRSVEMDDYTQYLTTSADVDFGNRSHIGQFGMDYLINEQNTLSFSFTHRNIKQNSNGIYDYDYRYALEGISQEIPTDSESTRNSEVDIDMTSWNYNASYIRKFAKEGQELSFDAAYTNNDAINSGKYEQDGIESDDLYNSDRKEAFIQMDYTQPVGNASIETGYMFRSNKINYDEGIDLSTAFNYKENIQALYIQYRGSKGKLSYQLGLRSEYSDINTNQDFNEDYLDFFPSVHLSYNLSANNQVNLSYSKMIYRPDSRMLNPFQNLQDVENQRIGLQDLEAYYTHIPELTFVFKRDKITFTTNLYYLFTDNIISQYRSVTSEDETIVTYENLGGKHYTGIDFNIATKFNKWWSINSYVSGIYQKYTSSEDLDYSGNDDFGFFAKLISTMRIPKWFTFQSIFRYDTDMPVAQGEYDQSFQMDLAFGKRIMKGKASLSLWVFDALNTSKYNVNTSGDRFSQRTEFKFENQVANLTFRYYFGKKYNVLKNHKKDSESHHSEKDI